MASNSPYLRRKAEDLAVGVIGDALTEGLKTDGFRVDNVLKKVILVALEGQTISTKHDAEEEKKQEEKYKVLVTTLTKVMEVVANDTQYPQIGAIRDLVLANLNEGEFKVDEIMQVARVSKSTVQRFAKRTPAKGSVAVLDKAVVVSQAARQSALKFWCKGRTRTRGHRTVPQVRVLPAHAKKVLEACGGKEDHEVFLVYLAFSITEHFAPRHTIALHQEWMEARVNRTAAEFVMDEDSKSNCSSTPSSSGSSTRSETNSSNSKETPSKRNSTLCATAAEWVPSLDMGFTTPLSPAPTTNAAAETNITTTTIAATKQTKTASASTTPSTSFASAVASASSSLFSSTPPSSSAATSSLSSSANVSQNSTLVNVPKVEGSTEKKFTD